MMVTTRSELPWQKTLIERGLERCRNGDWELGVEDLLTASQEGRPKDLPSLLYSYLGYALARTEGDVHRGLRFCRRAIKMEFYQPENYLNLARTHLLAKEPALAFRAIDRGLGFDPQHHDLLALREEIGERRPPVLPFLSRNHFFNRLFGRLRHDLAGPLTAIIGTAELLLMRETGMEDETREGLRVILAQCARIADLIARDRSVEEGDAGGAA